MHPPIAAINEHCCGVAAVVWALNNAGEAADQGKLIADFQGHFPAWTEKPGLLSRCEILRFLEMNKVAIGKFISSDRKDEILRFVNENGGIGNLSCAFVWTQEPTGHCMAVAGYSGDEIKLVDSDMQNPRMRIEKWDFLKASEGEMLLIMKRA
jgi:hypothetical protein